MASEQPRTVSKEWKWRRREAIIYDDYTCQECGARGGPEGNAELHVHHIEPVAEGGSDDPENLETLCRSCHEDHHRDDPVENSGWFEKEFEDQDFLDAISELDLSTTSDVADAVGCQYRTAYDRLSRLEEQGRVTSKTVGNSLLWSLENGGE